MADEGVPLARVEVTVPADAAPEVVFDHIVNVEGLGFVDGMTQDWRGGRAMVLVAPDAQDRTLLTLIADAPADQEAATEFEHRIRGELGRVARLVEGKEVQTPAPDADANNVGLDAIREDLAHGDREAPLDNSGS